MQRHRWVRGRFRTRMLAVLGAGALGVLFAIGQDYFDAHTRDKHARDIAHARDKHARDSLTRENKREHGQAIDDNRKAVRVQPRFIDNVDLDRDRNTGLWYLVWPPRQPASAKRP
jgi:hypothetical protein